MRGECSLPPPAVGTTLLDMRNSVLTPLSVFLLLVAIAANAQTAARPAWEWSLDERLEARLDPLKMKERLRAHREDMGPPQTASVREPEYVIDGIRNPELFLPYELMNSLMHGVSTDAGFRERKRESVRQRIREFGWDPDEFWARFERLAERYSTMSARREAAQQQATSAAVQERRALEAEAERLAKDLCAERARIIRAAREAWPAKEFDPFLYTVVAPSLSVAVYSTSGEAQQLRDIEAGCL